MTRCKPGDLAVFVPPAERVLIGRFVDVLSYEPLVSVLLRGHAWNVRLKGEPFPCYVSGKPINDGIAFDHCLQPIRPPATPTFEEFQADVFRKIRETFQIPADVLKVPAFDRLVLPEEVKS